jgi:hypothetical protein
MALVAKVWTKPEEIISKSEKDSEKNNLAKRINFELEKEGKDEREKEEGEKTEKGKGKVKAMDIQSDIKKSLTSSPNKRLPVSQVRWLILTLKSTLTLTLKSLTTSPNNRLSVSQIWWLWFYELALELII